MLPIRLFRWPTTEAIPIDLAEQDGRYVIGLWRDDCGDPVAMSVAWNVCAADGRTGWRPRGFDPNGTDQVHPTHFLPHPKGF